MKKFLRLLCLLGLALFFAASARSWILIQGQNIWKAPTIEMKLLFGSSVPFSDGLQRSDETISAMREWNDNMKAVQFTWTTQAAGSGTVSNGKNEVFSTASPYGMTWDDNTLAVTYFWTTGSSITEADILVNSTQNWDGYRGALKSDVSGKLIPEFRRVLLHEFGHVLGFDHPDERGLGVLSLMNSTISDTEHLTEDDQLGAGVTYGFGPANMPPPPVFAENMPSQDLYEGDRLFLDSRVMNSSKAFPLTYQWRKNGVTIAGATADSLQIDNLTTADSGDYSVSVSGPGGTSLSAPSKVSVLPLPLPILPETNDSTGNEGMFHLLLVRVNGHAYTVQWFKDGVAIPGATNEMLTFYDLKPSNAGVYVLKATNKTGTVASNPIRLTVLGALPPAIRYVTSDFTADLGANVQLYATFEATGLAFGSLYKDGVKIGDSFGNAQFSLSNLKASDAGVYNIVVKSAGGSSISKDINLRVRPKALVTKTEPAEQRTFSGAYTSIYADYNTNEVLSGTWYKDGVALTDAHRNELRFPSASVLDTGTYVFQADYSNFVRSFSPVSFSIQISEPNLSTPYNWVRFKKFQNIEYVLKRSSPAVSRYDLSARTWLPDVALPADPQGIDVSADGVYITFANQLIRYDLDLKNPTVVYTTPDVSTTLSAVVVFENHVWLRTSARTCLMLDRSTGTVLNPAAAQGEFRDGAGVMPLTKTFIMREFGGSNFAAYHLNPDGSVSNSVRWEYLDYQTDHLDFRFFADPAETFFLTSDGFVYDLGTFKMLAGFGGGFLDAVVTTDRIFILRGSSIVVYDHQFKEIGVIALSEPGLRLFVEGSDAIVMGWPGTVSGMPPVDVYPLSSIAPRGRAPVATPAGLSFSPESIAVDANGTLWLSDPARMNVHRWSSSSRGYLPSLALSGAPSNLQYSKEHDAVFALSGPSRIVKLDAVTGSETLFATVPRTADALVVAGDLVWASISFSWASVSQMQFVWDATGRLVSSGPLDGRVHDGVWDSAHRRVILKDHVRSVGWFQVASIGTGGALTPSASVQLGGVFGALPIKLSEDGQQLLFNQGERLATSDLASVSGQVSPAATDFLLSNDRLLNLLPEGLASLLEVRDSTTNALVSTQVLPGYPVALRSLPGGGFVAVTLCNRIPVFHLLGNDLHLMYSSAPADAGPLISSQPSGVKSAVGGRFTLSASSADPRPVTYQWYHDGKAIEGASLATLEVDGASTADAGTYFVRVATNDGFADSQSAMVQMAEKAPRMLNLSTRSFVGTADGQQIAGFVIRGESPKEVLVRASGPSLGAFEVAGFLPDPKVQLFSGARLVGENDDWGSSSEPLKIKDASSAMGAFSWSDSSKDAALLLTLAPGAYTAVVSGAGETSGVALVEVYETNRSVETDRLINISTRAVVKSGAQLEIAGFVIGGTTPKRLLVRAAGPTLAAFSVANALSDPRMEIFDEKKVKIYENNDWSSDTAMELESMKAAERVGAFRFKSGTKDASLVVTLAPGSYTVQVSSGDGSEGVSLIEVYEIQ